jgi:hypothetical protein
MKRLTIRIHAELDIPDDWQLADHPSGGKVIEFDGKFVTFFIEPVTTNSAAADAVWTDEDEDLTERILDSVSEVETDLEISYQH